LTYQEILQMPSYFRPGVYIEESLRPLSNLDVDPAEAAAAFVGVTKGGPVGPLLVTSWTQFQALFGSISYATDDLPFAVYNYFANGGRGAYIVRALPSDATAATLTLFDGTGTTTADEVLVVTASAPGIWASDANSASRVFLTVRPSVAGSNRFDVVVDVGNNTYLAASETFTDLSMDPGDTRYAVDVINSPVVGSKYVTVARSANIAVGNPAPGTVTKTPMTGGGDGVAAVDLVVATQRLDSVDRNLVINVPGATAANVSSIVDWAAAGGRHFVVADAPKPAVNETAAASVTAMVAFADALPNSSHVAVYGPWTYNADPGSTAGALRLTAPGGAVVGQYLRTDASRGVHKAPAGTQTTLAATIQPAHFYTNAQMDTLAQANFNLIRTVPGSGVIIWGARTQANITPDRYVPVRRLLISLKTSLHEITRFAVFEGNDEDLRALVEDTVSSFLQAQFDVGSFKGETPDEAFYVICDDTNNSPADVDAGLINVEVGVALKSPAEFVVIRLGQQQAGAVATDNLEEA
jgi:phage tail sheath protein FI